MRNSFQIKGESLAGDSVLSDQVLLMKSVQTADRFLVRGKESFAIDIKSSVDDVPGPGFRYGAGEPEQDRVRFSRPWISGPDSLPAFVGGSPKFCFSYRQHFAVAPCGQLSQSEPQSSQGLMDRITKDGHDRFRVTT